MSAIEGRFRAQLFLDEILERLELSAETWLDVVRNFRERFRNEAGLPQNRAQFRTARRHSRASKSRL
jgi:hypothetical protein